MATIPDLPTELLLYILQLSNEGESIWEQQRFRLRFGLIVRACYLAIGHAIDYYVAGEKQAKALNSKLERENHWTAQEDRKGRTTRSSLKLTGVSDIRRLSLVIDNHESLHIFTNLLRAIPDLESLDLEMFYFGVGTTDDAVPEVVWRACLVQVERAFKRLTNLKELVLSSCVIEAQMQLRILLPLKKLERLILPDDLFAYGGDPSSTLHRLDFPQLRDVRVRLEPGPEMAFANALLDRLASKSKAGL